MARSIEAVCLFLLLAVVGLRPLIAERYDSTTLEMTRALGLVEEASPTTTLLIDGVIMLASVGWLLAGALTGDRSYRRCGIEWGALIILLAAAVSCVAAGQRRLAVNGALDWLCCILLAVVLVQLLRDRWRIRLALCVVLASGVAQAVACFHQVHYSFEETEALYQEQRADIWSRQNVPLDSAQVELFENRMHSREAFGYLSHSNVAGAYLVLCGLTAAGLGLARWKAGATAAVRATSLVGFLVAAVVLAAAMLTHSRGALAGGAVAAGLCLFRLVYDNVCRRHARALFRYGWAALILVGVAVVGHGLYHGSLPGRSLSFRWHYWTASAQMVSDHPWTGVGSGNFGRHYLQYKPIASPEEVTNPHNFVVSAAAEWGLAGALGVLMMLYGASRVICLGGQAATVRERARPSEPRPSGGSRADWPSPSRAKMFGSGLLLAGMIFLVRVPLLGSDDPYHLYFETMLPLLSWAATFSLLIIAPIGSIATLITVMGFALVGFLLQDTINIATSVPPALTTVWACFSIVVAARYGEEESAPSRRIAAPIAAVCIAGVLLSACAAGIIVPAARANADLQDARRADSPTAALALYDRAADLDTWDSTALFEATRLLRGLAINGPEPKQAIDQAIRRIDTAIERDRFNIRLHREKNRCYSFRAGITKSEDDLTAAIAAAGMVFQLYPSDPASHVLLADAWAARGLAKLDGRDINQAIGHYEKALGIDDARPEWEVVRRLRPAERQALASRIEALRSAAETTTNQP